jgi:hypothetical protein
MRKKPIVLIVALLLFAGCFVSLQRNDESTAKDRVQAEHDVSIRHVDGRFLVVQTIRHIPEGIHEIMIPGNIRQLACENSAHPSCIWLNREKTKMAVGANENITFTYSIPAPKNGKHFLLEDWLVSVATDGNGRIRVQLSEEIWRPGKWLASAELVGMKKQKALDYYVFQAESELPVLYWSSEGLREVYSDQHFTIYSNKSFKADLSVLKKIKTDKRLFVIMANMAQKAKAAGSNTLIIPHTAQENEEQLLLPIIKNMLTFQQKDEWMADLIASALLERPIGDKKTKTMYRELKNALSGETIDQWLTLIFSAEKTISGETLNQFLEQAAHAKTDFFTANHSDGTAASPLHLIDKRDIYMNGKRAADVRIVHHGGQSYISFKPFAEALGYSVVQPGQNTATLAKRNETIQFYHDKKIFIKNGRKYGLSSHPFLLWEKEWFMRAGFAKTFFGLEIDEEKNEIVIKQKTLQ